MTDPEKASPGRLLGTLNPWTAILGIVVPIVFSVLVAALLLYGSNQFTQGKVDGLEKRFETFDKALDRFKDITNDLNGQIVTVRGATSELTGKIGELNGSVGAFKSQVDRLETNIRAIADLTIATAHLQSEHQAFAANLDALRRQIGPESDLARRLERIERGVNLSRPQGEERR